MYGWGKHWLQVTEVENAGEDGEWADVWVVSASEIPPHIDTTDPSVLRHGHEDLEEYLCDRIRVVRVKRDGRILKPDDIHL